MYFLGFVANAQGHSFVGLLCRPTRISGVFFVVCLGGRGSKGEKKVSFGHLRESFIHKCKICMHIQIGSLVISFLSQSVWEGWAASRVMWLGRASKPTHRPIMAHKHAKRSKSTANP